MTRSIERIFANHEAASDRRRRGLPSWDETVRIKQLFDVPDATDEDAPRIGSAVAKVLAASKWAARDKLAAAARGGDSEVAVVVEMLEDVEDIPAFNAIISRHYDLADADRVWIA